MDQDIADDAILPLDRYLIALHSNLPTIDL